MLRYDHVFMDNSIVLFGSKYIVFEAISKPYFFLYYTRLAKTRGDTGARAHTIFRVVISEIVAKHAYFSF